MESLKIQQKTSFTERFLATTNSASPLKVKPKFLASLRFKDRNRYGEGGTKFEILNIGFFFGLRNPRLWNAGYNPTNPQSYQRLESGVQVPLTIENPYNRIWNPCRGIKNPGLGRVPFVRFFLYTQLSSN